MNKLKVIGIDGSYPCFIKLGHIIEEYEVVTDNFRAPCIKVEPRHYIIMNKDDMSFSEFSEFCLYNSCHSGQGSIFINLSDVAVIKNKGERKMEYELKNPGKSWWVKGMIVEGEINERSEILEIDSIDICELNKDIMTKEQIIECMKAPRYRWGKAYLKEIKHTFTMLEKLLLEHQLEMGYKYITRDVTARRLNFFKNEPINIGGTWESKNENNYPVFDIYLKELYPFVSCENKEPTLIQDILNRYEVIENEKI